MIFVKIDTQALKCGMIHIVVYINMIEGIIMRDFLSSFKKFACKHELKKHLAFSLIELMISLIVVSSVVAAFAPVVSKKIQESTITIGNKSVTANCDLISKQCRLCTGPTENDECLMCDTTCPTAGTYLKLGECACYNCRADIPNAVTCKYDKEFKKPVATKCDPGYYAITDKNLNEYGTCQKCQVGHYCTGSEMKECTKGTYCGANDTCTTSCKKCSQGTYQDDEGQVACKKCSEGTYQADEGKEKCDPCPEGKYNNEEGSVSCATCTGSYNSGEGNKKCEPCAKGSCCHGTEKSSCKAGTYSDVGNLDCPTASNCTPCPDRKYCNKTGCTSCVDCPANSTGCDPATGAPKGCAKGYYVDGQECKQCPAGCSECTSATSCSSCNEWYMTIVDGVCKDTVLRVDVNGRTWTMRNAGDEGGLPIPENVAIYTIGKGCTRGNCGDTGSLTCWQGRTSLNCDNPKDSSGYSGCTRTVCTWNAAKAICESRGLKLPDSTTWSYFYGSSGEYHKTGQGVLCDRDSGEGDVTKRHRSHCAADAVCSGGGTCKAYRVWKDTAQDYIEVYDWKIIFKTEHGHFYLVNNKGYEPGSVRCIKK